MTDFREPNAGIFVAYTTPERVPGPDNKTISAGSQTLVNYIKGAKIKDIIIGGWKATNGKKSDLDLDSVRTVRVEIDPESLGLQYPIAANIAPNDDGLKTLMKAQEAGEAVNLAIESVRKAKNSKTKEPVSPLTPIYKLLGAENPGGEGDMGIAGRNTTKVIAAVNGVTTQDCRSDATQWASLQKNKAGNTSPEGFTLLTDSEDWSKYAVIVPEEGYVAPVTSNNGGSSNQDTSDLFDKLAAFLTEKLTVEGGRYVKRPTPGYINEGKPFDAFTSDKKISLGYYVASKYRYTFEWAWGYLQGVMQSKPDLAEVKKLTNKVIDLADKAQVKAYGGNVRFNRTVTSHTEACRWVQWAIENMFSWTNLNEDEVVDFVSSMMKDGGEVSLVSVQESLPDFAGQKQAPRNPQPETQVKDSGSDKMKNLENCLNVVNANWDNVDMLKKCYTRAKQLELLKAPVQVEDNKVTFSKGSETTLQEVLTNRGQSLKQENSETASTEPESETELEKPEASESATEESSDVQVTKESKDAPKNEVLDEDAFAALLTDGGTSENDWNEKLAAVSSVEEAQELWSSASANLQDTVVYEGESMTLSDAFQLLNAKFSDSSESSVEKAQELAESAVTAEDITQLKDIRKEANELNLLDVLVNDGVNDEELSLDTVIKNKRTELK